MSDLVAFLQAVLDEEEAWACSVVGDAATLGLTPGPLPWRSRLDTAARVLREVEAKRQILAEHTPRAEDAPPFIYLSYCPVCCNTKDSYEGPYREESPCKTLRLLVLPLSDRPDYRAEWKP